jgi:4-amino-4-deoxy-L-arabinose transferase-like glycosyltransferase
VQKPLVERRASHLEPPGLRPVDRRAAWGLLGLCLLLYVPYAGAYGLWDPWETHYAEVARSMLQRDDYLTTFWQDGVFKSKPVLTFWMQALGMAAFGLNQDGAPAGEMALSTAPEWGARLPVVLVSVLALMSIFLLVSRVVSRRAGVLATLVCATAPQYALISRQSITDIPFVALMTAGLCFFVLGLFVDDREPPAHWTIRLGKRRLTITAWHAFSAVFLLLVLPQLYLLMFQIGWRFERTVSLGGLRVRLYGLPYAIPWLALLGLYFVASWRSTERRAYQVYIHAAWLLCGLAVLAKGLGGILIPVAVVGLYVLLLREPALVRRLEILKGAALMLLVAAPWHHAMWIRHGNAFWNEYFGHHHFKRAQLGVHGERGSHEYFVHQLGFGLFPWSALVPAALIRWAGFARPSGDRRSRLVLFALLWAAATFALFSIMETKFHHYALPVIPPAAILLGLWLDDLPRDRRAGTTLLIVLGVGLLLLLCRDLVKDPSHLVVMFIYKYNRLFPYELGFEPWVVGLSLPLVMATALLAVRRARRYAIWALTAVAVLFTLWSLNHYQLRLAPHWGQKNLHAIYHRARRGPEERLIAWQLNWRGENFYSKNQVIVHMQPKETPRFKAFLRRHTGQRFYLIMEQGRLGTLKSILKSVGAQRSLELVGPGGKAWPDNWIPHFRVQRIKVLYREKDELSETCRRFKRRLSALPVPAGAARFRGSAMADNWWGGHCREFVQAERKKWRRRCGPREPAASAKACARQRAELRRRSRLCEQAREALGPYPYRECFEQYPNNKFLLVRFTP